MDRYDYYGLAEDDKHMLESEEFLKQLDSEILDDGEYIYQCVIYDLEDMEEEIIEDGSLYVDVYPQYDYECEYDLAEHFKHFFKDVKDDLIYNNILSAYGLYDAFLDILHDKSESYIYACIAYFIDEISPMYMRRNGSKIENKLGDVIWNYLESIDSEICDAGYERYSSYEPDYDPYEDRY